MNNSTENKIIVFNMGSALINSEAIDALAKAAGVISKVEEITKKAICGDLDFWQVLAERVSLLEKIGFAIAFNPTHIRREYTDVVIQKRSSPLALLLNLFLSYCNQAQHVDIEQ
jgi:hypothetical protein